VLIDQFTQLRDFWFIVGYSNPKYLNRNGHKAGRSSALLCKLDIYHFKERDRLREERKPPAGVEHEQLD